MINFVEIKDKDGVTLGQLPVSSEGGRLRDIVYMTESGAYAKPAWLKFTIVKGVAGGGGGAGVAATGASTYALGGGGAGGGYFEKMILATDLASSETVTIGGGGMAGAAGVNNGGTGYTTSFGSHCSATGGTGGEGGAASSDAFGKSGVGGTFAGADFGVNGSAPMQCRMAGGVPVIAGEGGRSHLSPPAIKTLSNSAGSTGLLFGGGGAGAVNLLSQSARAGGAGAPGIVIIEEYE